MKLHYSTESATNSRFRKIKAVIKALKLNVEEVGHDSNADLSNISVFNTLPILETKEGSFFSSNAIIRYLAASNGNQLYGADLHQRALVDQWLDITTCDFEAAVAAVSIAKDGREVDGEKILADLHKFLNFVEKHLNGKKFLVGDSVSLADYSLATSIAVVLSSFGEEERKAWANISKWYLSIAALDEVVGGKDFPKDNIKAFRQKKEKHDKKDKKDKKKEEKKEEEEEEFDPFADDDTPAAPKAAPKKAEPKKAAPKKEKPAAKSIVVFDVKVYEEGYDLDGLWEKIKKEVVMDGLVWNNEPKKIPVVGQVFKLQIGCVIEDAKVQTDDIFEKIESWDDDVQSTDVVSFQKL